MKRIFDTHAHYFDARFETEYEGGADALLPELFSGGVEKIVNVGTNLQNSVLAVRQAANYPGMFAAVGIHPEDCHAVGSLDDAMEKLSELLGTPDSRDERKIVAIGEIGLDYHYENYGEIPLDKPKEKRFFRAQMEIAQMLDLPVIVHDREAHGDCFDVIRQYPGVRGVFHSYSGSAEMAKDLVRRGWYLSFGGPLTFKNAARVREAALAVPRDRLLVETDCPYLSPEPFRGKLNHSGRLEEILSVLAGLWNCSPEEAARVTNANACRFFQV